MMRQQAFPKMARTTTSTVTMSRTTTATTLFLFLVVLCISLLQVASQPLPIDDATPELAAAVCRAPKPSVALPNPNVTTREYLVGANSWHIPVLDYLTHFMGGEFDPPISFRRQTANHYLNRPIEEAKNFGYDFMIAHPYASSCYESEGQAVTLANQMIINQDLTTGQFYNLTQYGATLYTLKNRTDIRSLQDVKGKKIGTNKITNLATHLCYDVLLRNGIHHLQDPEQTIFFRNSREALEAVLAGKVDVGCAATSVLEKFIDPSTGQPLDVRNRIRILDPQQHMTDGIHFPFQISSVLVPGYLVSAFPHVEPKVKERVQRELLAMRDHSDVAPSLFACLEGKGCLRNNTACLQTCFDQDISATSIQNCDTTPEKAIMAYEALKASRLVGWSEPLKNIKLRDIQETTGFLIKDPPEPRCVRLSSIVDATTCPPGHFARSSQEIIQQCNNSGLQCYDEECICKPCVEAFEVDFFSVPTENTEEDTDDQSVVDTSMLSRSNAVGSGCSKFSLCGTVEQEHSISFRAIDNKERLNATLTGAMLLADESEEPFEFENINGTFCYDFVANKLTAGQKIIKIRINDEEIPESPFRIVVTKRDCVADTGDSFKEPNDVGECVCKGGTIEFSGGRCIALAVLIPSIVVPCVVLFLIGVHFYVKHKKDQADNIWKVDPAELKFDDPPRVLGRGTFGMVLLAEYRGTQVAVKRVLPPSKQKYMAGMPTHVEFKGELVVEATGGPNSNASIDSSASDLPPEGPVGRNEPPISGGGGFISTMSSPSGIWKRQKRSWCRELVADKMRFVSSNVLWKRKTAQLQENFVEEIRLLSRLRHPSITTVMGAVIAPKVEPMLVMEYMHFGSLHDLLHNESMVLEGTLLVGLLQDVASGLRFLHSSDPLVLHGDLKSQNILVDDKFRAKVADFGCGDFVKSRKGNSSLTTRGKSSTGLRKTPRIRGTPYWMAPELLRGESTNTKESDVYAFGVVMYEVFSRKEPYSGESYDEVLRRVSDEAVNYRPPIPDSCPLEISKMMKACFQYDPAQRPTAMGLDIRLRWMDGTSVMTFDVTKKTPPLQTSSSSRSESVSDNSRADSLFDQMFPRHIAQALREGRKVEPETHEEVTIVFCNIVGYAEIASAMSATKVSDLLNRLYHSFDNLCDSLNVFKVETIGDAYMAVTNLVEKQPHHVSLAAQFAVEAMLLASTVPIDVEDESAGFVQLSLGFHTGPVVTHVIGSKNARFTLIGDTVNTAARMESTSLPGKIQCSEDSHRLLVKDDEHAREFDTEERGVVKIKGKGAMKTYWIEPASERVETC